MSKAKSGGGALMNKNVKPGVRWGDDKLNKVSPKGTSQLGTAVDPKVVEPLIEGRAKDFVELGNKVALNVGKGGPGTGRDVHPSGSQQQWGSARKGEPNTAPDVPASKPGRDILSQYGGEGRK